MKRSNSLLFISAGFLIALVFVLTYLGWNDNKQKVEPSAQPETFQDQPQSSDHQDVDAFTYLAELLPDSDDTTSRNQILRKIAEGTAVSNDFVTLKSFLGSNPALDAFCDMNIALGSQNWTEFDIAATAFSASDLKEDFIHHSLEPVLVKAIELNPNILYHNMLADIYLHDQSNPQRFMGGIRQLRQVLELDSNNEQAIYKLAIFSVQSNQLEKAKQRFKKLISLQPENEGYRKMLEELETRTREPEKEDSSN